MSGKVLQGMGYLIRIATAVVLLVVVLPTVYQAMGKAERCTAFSWGASKQWAVCAETARAEGVWLAARVNGVLKPAADVSLADDIGHNLLCTIVSVLSDRSVVPSDVVQINVALCAFGSAAMICLLLAARFDIAALILSCSVSTIIQEASAHATSPHLSHDGLVLLALVLPCVVGAIAQAGKQKSLCEDMAAGNSSLCSRSWIILGFVCSAAATLVRGAYFALAVAAFVGCVAAGLWLRNRTWQLRFASCRRVLFTSAILVALLMYLPIGILRARDAIWNVAPATCIEFHGLSHNLVIGLGAVDNSLGVEWLDQSGLDLAKKLDPNVGYVTPRYYALLWQQYFSFWEQHPREMVAIYARKCRALLTQTIWGFVPLWSVGVVSLAMAAFAFTRFQKWPGWSFSHAIILTGACIMIYLLLAQGVATHHRRGYWRPIEILFALEIAVFVDLAVGVVARSIRAKSGAVATPQDTQSRWLLTIVAVAVTVGPVLLCWGPAAP